MTSGTFTGLGLKLTDAAIGVAPWALLVLSVAARAIVEVVIAFYVDVFTGRQTRVDVADTKLASLSSVDGRLVVQFVVPMLVNVDLAASRPALLGRGHPECGPETALVLGKVSETGNHETLVEFLLGFKANTVATTGGGEVSPVVGTNVNRAVRVDLGEAV